VVDELVIKTAKTQQTPSNPAAKYINALLFDYGLTIGYG
jgi:hypothetical protein